MSTGIFLFLNFTLFIQDENICSCGDKGNEWGSVGGKGRVSIYQIN